MPDDTDAMTPSQRRNFLPSLMVLLLCIGIGTVVVPVWSAPRSLDKRPLVKITKAPPPKTSATKAVFRFRRTHKATRTSCRLDKQRYRRCRVRAKYKKLPPGRHTFTVRARRDGRTTYERHRWTVVSLPKPRKLLFADEFSGPTLDTEAWYLYNGPGHSGNGLRRPSAFSLDGQGHLVVTAQMLDGRIVSGGMSNRLDFTYGRVEFRVRTDFDPTGTMSGVVLTWPKEQSAPEFTENDMYETGPFVNNNRHFESFIHFGPPEKKWQKWATHNVNPSEWHTVAMEWQRNLLEIYVDGQLGFTVTDPAVIPDVLHHVCIQLDARAKRTLTKPVQMMVDYVRIYQ